MTQPPGSPQRPPEPPPQGRRPGGVDPSRPDPDGSEQGQQRFPGYGGYTAAIYAPAQPPPQGQSPENDRRAGSGPVAAAGSEPHQEARPGGEPHQEAGPGAGPYQATDADAGIGFGRESDGRGRNPFAIAALVFGLIGLFPLGAAAGMYALSQIRRRPQRGRGMAMVGLAASAAWAVATLVFIIMLALSDGDAGQPAPDGGAGQAKPTAELAPGECLNGLREARSITSLPVVPCTEPHEGEVFGTFTVPDGAWPGEQALAGQAETGCVQRLAEYSAKAAADPKLEIYFLHPTERTWARGDREVTCVAEDPAGARTGSLRD